MANESVSVILGATQIYLAGVQVAIAATSNAMHGTAPGFASTDAVAFLLNIRDIYAACSSHSTYAYFAVDDSAGAGTRPPLLQLPAVHLM